MTAASFLISTVLDKYLHISRSTPQNVPILSNLAVNESQSMDADVQSLQPASFVLPSTDEIISAIISRANAKTTDPSSMLVSDDSGSESHNGED